MKCWKCKSDMPEGLKYCGNCGVHLNRAVYFAQWLFSKKGLPLLLILAAVILGGALWGILSHTAAPGTDWIAMIRSDLYSEDSTLTRAIDKAVTITLAGEDKDSITVEVSAPDVCDAAVEWFLTVSDEDYSDQALENTLLELLKGRTTTASFTLAIGPDGKPDYPDDFLDATSGGVRDFYAALTAMFMEEMEASVNE